MSDRKQMHLGAFMTTYLGHHLAAWRYPATKTEQVTHLALYREIAELTEKGKFDILFLADVLAINPEGIGATPEIRMDATTMMATLTALTSKVGLVSTVSTTYNHPFNVARKFSTIDHLSGGRAAWNVVTSAHQNEAENLASTATWSTATATPRARSSCTSPTRCGTAGTTTRCCSTAQVDAFSMTPRCAR